MTTIPGSGAAIQLTSAERIIEMIRGHEDNKGLFAYEARRRWGDTEAYKESERRTAGYTADDWNDLSAGLDELMEGFARLKKNGISPGDEQAISQTDKLRSFITERMYTCTDEILAGLGEMYVADERFTRNIDRHGEGTAAYIAECIKNYLA